MSYEMLPGSPGEFDKADQDVIDAAVALIKSRDGKTYCPDQPQVIDGQLFRRLDRAVVARRVARGLPR